MLLTSVFCVSKWKGMAFKKALKRNFLLLMAGNSSRTHEKIRLHFEISFGSLTDSIKYFD